MTKTTNKKCTENYAVYCNKAQYNEASILEKLKLNFHILFCEDCHTFVKKNTQLSQLIHSAKLNFLHQDEKDDLQSKINHDFSHKV